MQSASPQSKSLGDGRYREPADLEGILSESFKEQTLQTVERLGLGRAVHLPSQFLLLKTQDRRRGVGKTGCKVYIQEYNVYLKYLQCGLKQYFYNFLRSTTMYLTGKLQWFNLQN